MMNTKTRGPEVKTPAQISQAFNLLSLQCQADLIDGDDFRARRKQLYDEIVRMAARRAEQNISDVSWYPVEVTTI